MSKAVELESWLREQQLERHMPKLMDVDGSIGLSSVEDLLNFNEEDLNDIVNAVSMNLSEKKRFMRGVQNLKSALQAESEEMTKGEVITGASPIQTSRGGSFSTAMATKTTAADALNISNVEEESAGKRAPMDSDDKERVKLAYERYQELPSHADIYEVVKSTVFVLKEPHPDAARVGVVRQGNLIHASRERVVGKDGYYWVELTNLELWRSCEPHDIDDRGYALINGAHRGLGQLLQGPLPRDFKVWLSMPHNIRVSHMFSDRDFAALPPAMPGSVNNTSPVNYTSPGNVQAAPPGAMSAFKGPTAYATVYKVVKNLVYVKASPNKDSTNVGCLKQGDTIQVFKNKAVDFNDHAWVELTNLELWRSCTPQDTEERGFVLIDGTHLKLGPLLEGPGSQDDCARWYNKMANEYGRLLAKQKQEQEQFKETAKEIRERIKEGTFDNSTGILYRTLHSNVYVKWGQDPRKAPASPPMSCVPGTYLYTTGIDWFDAAGDQWVDACCLDGRRRWYLVRGHQGDQEVPLLIEDSESANHIHVKIGYQSNKGSQVFEVFMSAKAPAKHLLNSFCDGTKLNRLDITLKMRDIFNNEVTVDKAKTLRENGVSESTFLFAMFSPPVFAALNSGRSCGWL